MAAGCNVGIRLVCVAAHIAKQDAKRATSWCAMGHTAPGQLRLDLEDAKRASASVQQVTRCKVEPDGYCMPLQGKHNNAGAPAAAGPWRIHLKGWEGGRKKMRGNPHA